jgi:hypothetical protein
LSQKLTNFKKLKIFAENGFSEKLLTAKLCNCMIGIERMFHSKLFEGEEILYDERGMDLSKESC